MMPLEKNAKEKTNSAVICVIKKSGIVLWLIKVFFKMSYWNKITFILAHMNLQDIQIHFNISIFDFSK